MTLPAADVPLFTELEVDLAVVLGQARVPLREMLKMSRGAIIALDTALDDPCAVMVNGRMVARGEVEVNDEAMALAITETHRAGAA